MRCGRCTAGGGAVLVLALSLSACVSAPRKVAPRCPLPAWDIQAAEIKQWAATNPDYAQDRALEGSGLVADGWTLYATSEKYRRLLKIDSRTLEVDDLELDLAKHSELEGVTLMGGQALLCDEAHAAVFAVELGAPAGRRGLPAQQVQLRGIEVEGGKLGLEGITAVDDSSGRVFLLLERSGDAVTGCSSSIFPMHRVDDVLEVVGSPLSIALEDCNWRLTGLQWWNGWLVALKTRFPGERYEIVTVDTTTGAIDKVLDLTEFLVGVRQSGWGNNVEGITVTPDGALWLISDNAMTDVIDLAAPPPARDRTLLLRLPAVGPVCAD